MSALRLRPAVWLTGVAILVIWSVGIFGRGYWTPDEPREADISWRMSWQANQAVPLLAGEAFCEKPPLTYWLAGASIRALGADGWAARVPNLLYAMLTTLSVAWLARRLAGTVAAVIAAAASATLLLSYQVAIWLATDAPLLAATALALAGAHTGFYATNRRQRLLGYTVMHAALAAGFLAKSAAAWMVPVLVLGTLVVWERRWRELLRWELWLGLALQALLIGSWIWTVYAGPDGPDHLKVFFWNNLVGRFTHVDAPADLQYAQAHQNSPGKYLLEMPIYLFPWTLLVVAAALRAWDCRRTLATAHHAAVRWALAGTLPALALLSVAATARNIYFAPSLPAVALLLGWWGRETCAASSRADRLALHATALLLGIASIVLAAAVLLGLAATHPLPQAGLMIALTAAGTLVALWLVVLAWRAVVRRHTGTALLALLLAYACLLGAPASQAYRLADRWQDLGALGAALRADLHGAPLLLLAADETTRAWVDLYVSTTATRAALPPDVPAAQALAAQLRAGAQPRYALLQLPGRSLEPGLVALARRLGLRSIDASAPATPPWVSAAGLHTVRRYELPNGRRYALLAASP